LGHAPLPAEDFTAMVAGAEPAGTARLIDSPAELSDRRADVDVPSPTHGGQCDRPTKTAGASAVAAATATTVATDDRQSPPSIYFTGSRPPANLAPAESGRNGFPTRDAGARPHAPSQAISPELAGVIQAWPGLPSYIQAAIVAMVQSDRDR